jgi:hypothetical protein
MLQTVCSDTACWDATGSMMQGWGAILAPIAIVYAAWKAADTFKAFRRQKQEERRIDAADHILTFAYKFKRALQAVRSPGIMAHELDAAEKRLKESWQGWDDKTTAEQQQLRTAQAIWGRLQSNNEIWGQIFEHMPKARALFGEEVEAQLQAFWTAYVEVETSCDMYAEDTGTDQEFTKKLRQDMWRRSKDDPVAKIVDEAIQQLEQLLLPIIRADYNPPKGS